MNSDIKYLALFLSLNSFHKIRLDKKQIVKLKYSAFKNRTEKPSRFFVSPVNNK